MAYKAVIFDLDGTLVNSLQGIAAALNFSLDKNELPTHSVEKVRTFIGDGTWMLCRKATASELPDSLVDEVNEGFKHFYNTEWKAGTHPYEGIEDLLQQCKQRNILLAVVSNKTDVYTKEIVHTLFPNIPFDSVVGLQDGIPKKPAPDSTLVCLKSLNIPAEQCLFVGDSTIDIQTARAAQIDSAAVTWGYHDEDALAAESPTHTASTLAELTSLILA